jgi:predicted CoA-substrate-specific enzyme activase
MNAHPHILGLDIGSAAVGLAEISADGRIGRTAYGFHHGDIRGTIIRMLTGFQPLSFSHLATTGSLPRWVKKDRHYHPQVCYMATARQRYHRVGAILAIGAETFALIQFSPDGDYLGSKINTACAAGTGSFLDQQARRLGLRDTSQLADQALCCRGIRPQIASRCAVFAKTDLIHAQQVGFGLAEICDGLCHGLAQNVVDTLFKSLPPLAPILFCGGVSRNCAVKNHISRMIGVDPITDPVSHLYGAIGAGLLLIEELSHDQIQASENYRIRRPGDLIVSASTDMASGYAPLSLNLSHYPDFSGLENYKFQPPKDADPWGLPVEVDLYQALNASQTLSACLGIDIGSTSTKAVLLDAGGNVMAGFYTRTAGRPLKAVQSIFRAIDDFSLRKNIQVRVAGCATTGSGRKFIGKVVGADLILDEISAHARAACELNPAVDTIIEIGGQDAKFTTLRDQRVTSCSMNTVCAAGTGSFIEELADKLGCPLSEFATRAQNQNAPRTSDRCTVFMERDINHYLSQGYRVDQVLASVLHSVRENYLRKVATESHIGDAIFFQGATAKNKALVAAFEQRLGKPIMVSKFCHLTGAMGCALTLLDENRRRPRSTTRFRGIDLCKETIAVRTEVCALCTNHCKISIAKVGQEELCYGFLCGRDYHDQRYMPPKSKAFNLLTERRKVFEFRRHKASGDGITIGIPAAMHLLEDLPQWQYFFNILGIQTITSENFNQGLKSGKHLCEAEFCAPMIDLHGHVDFLLKRADFVFLPHYFEDPRPAKDVRRQFCYYTQYAPALAAALDDAGGKRVLRPMLKYLYTAFHVKMELYRMLRSLPLARLSYFRVAAAYDAALEFKQSGLMRLRSRLRQRMEKSCDVSVVLLGRPYNVLSASLNSGIPALFASLGIDCYDQEMLTCQPKDAGQIQSLLSEVHWRNAAAMLTAAKVAAGQTNLYPVLMTSFKCSPDSFAVDYFKNIMDSHHKPYLILELDAHDSRIGYETRIEAAVRAFRNHRQCLAVRHPAPVQQTGFLFSQRPQLSGKTVVLPNWDPLTCPLLAANLRREGIPALVMKETKNSIQRALVHNTGQCIPLNAIAQGYMECIEENRLDPAKTVLWLSKSEIACNIKLYPLHIETLCSRYGRGKKPAGVYRGPLSFIDIGLRAAVNTYFAYMFGGLLRKLGCKLRPYEAVPGSTDRLIEKGLDLLCEAFEGNCEKLAALSKVIRDFSNIATHPVVRPRVAVFGDFYCRDNDVMNQDLIHFIEAHGAEVVTTPYHQYAKMVAGPYFRKWFQEGKYLGLMAGKGLLTAMGHLEKAYYCEFQSLLKEPDHTYDEAPEEILARYFLRLEHTGESMDNLIKIHYLKKFYPDLSLLVQANPALCCPSLVTEAMGRRIEEITGIPVVSVTYDGTGGCKNDILIPYLKYPRQAREKIDRRQSRG